MKVVTLKIPSHCDLFPALEFSRTLASHPTDMDFLMLDFSGLAYVKPFGMLVVAQTIQSFRKRAPQVKIAPVPHRSEAERYAAHMGFFQACGIDLGKQPGQAKGSDRYLPLTYRETQGLASPDEHLGTQISRLSLQLAQMLTQDTSGAVVDVLEYSFREIIRNVAEHSQSPDFGYCAQYWSKSDEVEIALIDRGIGLRASLAQNPYLQPHLQADRDALKLALMPGISGKVYPGKKSDDDDPWENSGFGLYMNYRLCNEGGSFFIASGQTGLYREKEEDNRYLDCVLPGVALCLRMKVNRLTKLDQLLRQFAREGEEAAKTFAGGVVPQGDRLSMMLRKDFNAFKPVFQAGMRVRHVKHGTGIINEVIEGSQGIILKVQFSGGRTERVHADTVKIVTEELP